MATTVFDTPTDSKQDKSDNTLTTTAKTVVGAINELNSDLAAKKELVVTQKTDANDCIPSGNKTYEVFVLPHDAAHIPSTVWLFVQAFKAETNYVTQIATSMTGSNRMYIRHFTIGGTIPDWEEMALDTNVSAKRTTILTSSNVASDTSILTLENGAYQVADNNLNTSYIPEKWGTLVVNKSGTTYGEFTFVGTSGNTYVRHANGNSAWHGNGWAQLALNSKITPMGSYTSIDTNITADKTINHDFTQYRYVIIYYYSANFYRQFIMYPVNIVTGSGKWGYDNLLSSERCYCLKTSGASNSSIDVSVTIPASGTWAGGHFEMYGIK